MIDREKRPPQYSFADWLSALTEEVYRSSARWREENAIYTIHLENGEKLFHLNRADTIQALIEHPGAKLEVYENSLESAQEVADMEREVVEARRDWCIPDRCPSDICGGPHYVTETDLGDELLRLDQSPIGKPIVRCPFDGGNPCRSDCPSMKERACVNGDD